MSESTWIWGRHPVLEALRAGTARSVLVAAGRRPSPVLEELQGEARRRGVPMREVPASEVQRLAPGQNTQGVAAEILTPRAEDLASLLDAAEGSATLPFLLALDQVQDPHNIGALMRTADAAGAHGVILPERRSAALSGVVAKVSAGAMSHLPVVEVTNLSRALDEIRERGIWTIGLEESAPTTVFQSDLTVPLVLVVGSEGSGLRRLTRHHCDLLVHLPMLGHVESLNASVAGSIVMYEVVRQRLAAQGS